MQCQLVHVGSHSFRVCSRLAFWHRVSAGLWEPRTFAVLDRFLDRAHSCIDVGAWVGPTVLYGASLARRVHALEPDLVALGELEANLQANPELQARVQLHAHGIAARSGALQLYAGGFYWADASAFGDSMSGIFPAPGVAGQPHKLVTAMAMDEFMDLHRIDDCNFIKMDIEGGEYAAIPGVWRRLHAHGMPTLYISFHAPEPARRQSMILSCLDELAHCYRWFIAGGEPVEPLREAEAVRDWGDEHPASPWRRLEDMLGAGLVATNREW
jgi:FkbM family methyltransferase